MADVLLVAGDDFEHPMWLEGDGTPEPIPLTATVNAALVDETGVTLISSTAVDSETAGSDWPSGKVVVKFTGGQTAGLVSAGSKKLGRIYVRVTTAGGKKNTWRSELFTIEPSPF